MEKKKLILLVEDNPDDIELTRRAFKRSHILNELVVVTDGLQAVNFLFGSDDTPPREAREMPEVILLDLKLPKIDGLEVLRRIRSDSRSNTIPVVVLTSSKEEQDLVASYKLGANSYIRKPVDFEQFSEAVRQLQMYWLLLNEPSKPAI